MMRYNDGAYYMTDDHRFFMFFLWLIVMVDLVLLGVWLYQKVTRKP